MLIRDIFATKIQERIEAVVKVADRNPAIVLSELKNLVITEQWERHIRHILEEYTDAFESEDERGIGIWISGFFGSGKSLLMKVLGLLLEGGEIRGESIHELFLSRLPQTSTERADIERFLSVCRHRIATSLVGGNLHARQARPTDPLALNVFKLFAESRGYTNNWAFAWSIEYQIDVKEHTEDFRRYAQELSGVDWEEIVLDSDVYSELLYEAAARVIPELVSGLDAVKQAVTNAFQSGIDPKILIDRLRRWCIARDKGGMRHKLLLQLDELGQWIRSGSNTTARLMEVEVLVETASTAGQGRIWMAVTAHGDVQEVQPDVEQALYATINQRFALQCKLTNEDIYAVVQERLLRKTLAATSALRQQFQERGGELIDLGSLKGARRVYAPPDVQNFVEYYPYFPWTVTAIPNIIKGIAQSTGLDEALTGSNRTMIGMVQSGILDTAGVLDAPTGRIICLLDLYEKLSGDAPNETRTDINRITASVREAKEETVNVARVLYLLGRDPNIPCTLDNVSRTLVNSFDVNLGVLRTAVEIELERLIAAGYAKKVGDLYYFLTTQQRSFQRRVREREAKWYEQIYELSLKVKDYDSDDALRFDLVPVHGVAGREKQLKIVLDSRTIRNPSVAVTIHVYSPLQRILDPDIQNDVVLKQRSNQDQNSFILRMGDVKEFRRALARAVATAEAIEEATNKPVNDPERKVAEQARADLVQYQDDVRRALAEAMRSSTLFFRGTVHNLMDGSSASGVIRNTLSYLLPDVYPRFIQLPHRIVNEESAVKAALSDNTNNEDLQKLGVYTSDGSLNESGALISTLKGKIPQAENDQGFINADTLRSELEKPPFGWDGQAVKVGVALLLRASSCRLIVDGGKPVTDPRSPEALQYLTKDLSFKRLRIQGMRSELKSAELLAIRGYMETIFGIRLTAIAPTLNTELGKQLDELQKLERELRDWAATTSCPFPNEFETGRTFVAELSENTTFATRLPLFASKWETLDQHNQLVQTLLRFKKEQGGAYVTVRDFFNSVKNLDPDNLPGEVRTFIDDWRTVTRERTVIDPASWNSVMKAYRNAQHALTNQIAQWRQDIEHELVGIEASLKERVQAAGVPDEYVEAEVAALSTDAQELRKRLAKPDLNYSEVSSTRKALSNFRLNLANKVREASARYQAKVTYQPQEVHLTWQDVMGHVRIDSQDDVERVVSQLRTRIQVELGQQKNIIIE